ncbi:MAG: CDP-diacylglycerol--serine O-phosphatidyltransferase [Bacteroidales bacterium]|nr:CDP-diacylglycerol--serine O-phosphatidyltransferase [Bacteroidales bacterium]
MKATRYIPDLITSMNLLSGVLGVIFTFKGRFEIAFPLMLAASVFDFCDGLAARALDAYSDLGKELDSLSDMVSFGVLPALMLYQTMRVCTFSESWLCYIPLVLAVFSGIRLAKFNVDERQHDSFIGLATPSAAMICGSLCYFIAPALNTFLAAWAAGYLFIPVLAVVLSALLVCEIPMFSMKFGKGKESDPVTSRKRISFLVNVAVIVAIVASLGLNWSLAVLLTFVVYALMNIVFALFRI